jgi:hypothetical protein
MRKLEQLAMLSQISQAEAKKFFIEQTRLKNGAGRDHMVEYAGLLAADLGCGGGITIFHKSWRFTTSAACSMPVVHGLRRAGELVP